MSSEKGSRIPSIIIYSLTYLAVLSKVDHKELRFYAPIAQLGCLSQALSYTEIHDFVAKRYRGIFRLVVILLFVVDGIKYTFSFVQYGGIYYSMMEPYNIFNGRTHHLYDENGLYMEP